MMMMMIILQRTTTRMLNFHEDVEFEGVDLTHPLFASDRLDVVDQHLGKDPTSIVAEYTQPLYSVKLTRLHPGVCIIVRLCDNARDVSVCSIEAAVTGDGKTLRMYSVYGDKEFNAFELLIPLISRVLYYAEQNGIKTVVTSAPGRHYWSNGFKTHTAIPTYVWDVLNFTWGSYGLLGDKHPVTYNSSPVYCSVKMTDHEDVDFEDGPVNPTFDPERFGAVDQHIGKDPTSLVRGYEKPLYTVSFTDLNNTEQTDHLVRRLQQQQSDREWIPYFLERINDGRDDPIRQRVFATLWKKEGNDDPVAYMEGVFRFGNTSDMSIGEILKDKEITDDELLKSLVRRLQYYATQESTTAKTINLSSSVYLINTTFEDMPNFHQFWTSVGFLPPHGKKNRMPYTFRVPDIKKRQNDDDDDDDEKGAKRTRVVSGRGRSTVIPDTYIEIGLFNDTSPLIQQWVSVRDKWGADHPDYNEMAALTDELVSVEDAYLRLYLYSLNSPGLATWDIEAKKQWGRWESGETDLGRFGRRDEDIRRIRQPRP